MAGVLIGLFDKEVLNKIGVKTFVAFNDVRDFP